MIPRADIVAWRSRVFWRSDAQVEHSSNCFLDNFWRKILRFVVAALCTSYI